MRRIKLVLAAATVMVAMLAAFSGSAMADDLTCRDAYSNLIRCDGQYYAPVDNYYPYYDSYYPFYWWWFNPYYDYEFGPTYLTPAG